jgi:selenide,water dikinase
VDWASIALLPGAHDFAREGIATGASGRNWSGYGDRVRLGPRLGEAEKALLTDPQTSGGLLVACDPKACDDVLSIFRSEGFGHAAVVGEIVEGTGEVLVD